MKKRRKNIKGFTLLEIMIVIGIMATLLTVVIPAFQRSRSQAKLTTCMKNLKNMATCVEMYSMDNLQTPPTTSDGLQKLVDTGYIKSIPIEPVGATYTYEGPSVGSGVKNYTIMCGDGSTQAHGDLGVPPGCPYYTPEVGQASGLGI